MTMSKEEFDFGFRGLTDEIADAFQGDLRLDAETSMRFSFSHLMSSAGLELMLVAREVRIVHDCKTEPTELGTVKNFQINGVDLGSGGKLSFYRPSAVETGRAWIRRYMVEQSALSLPETELRKVLRRTFSDLVQMVMSVLFERTIEDEVAKILTGDDLPQRWRAGHPDGHPLYNAICAAEAKPDGTFKLPIDEYVGNPGEPAAQRAARELGVSCGHTLEDCKLKFDNHPRYGGRPGMGLGAGIPCPFRLGDKHCGVDEEKVREVHSRIHGVDLGTGETMSGRLTKKTIRMNGRDVVALTLTPPGHVSIPAPDGGTLEIENGGVDVRKDNKVVGRVKAWVHDEVQIEITDPELRRLLAQQWDCQSVTEIVAAAPTTDEELISEEKLPESSSLCEDCWGTGYYRGAGAPCPRGCRPPRP